MRTNPLTRLVIKELKRVLIDISWTEAFGVVQVGYLFFRGVESNYPMIMFPLKVCRDTIVFIRFVSVVRYRLDRFFKTGHLSASFFKSSRRHHNIMLSTACFFCQAPRVQSRNIASDAHSEGEVYRDRNRGGGARHVLSRAD